MAASTSWCAPSDAPCGASSTNCYNANYAHRRLELEELQAGVRWQIVFAVANANLQMSCGWYFLIENPVRSRAWLEDPLVRLEANPRVHTVSGHRCAHNLRFIVEPHRFLYKPHKWMTNHPGVARLLDTKGPGKSEHHQHKNVEGANTKHSGSYTEP